MKQFHNNYIYMPAYLAYRNKVSVKSELMIFCQYWKLTHQLFSLLKSTSESDGDPFLICDMKTPNLLHIHTKK